MQNDLTDITIVLDRSGSMSSVREDTIGGFNTFLEEQKAVPGRADFSLVQFDDKYEVLYEGRPLQDAPPLTLHSFVPRGSTALLDAIGRTINAIGARLASVPGNVRAGKVLFVIMTDGLENASREFTPAQIHTMITHQREKYQWQIVFIGANQDAIATGASYGIPSTNSLNYAVTSVGTRSATASLSAAAGHFRRRRSLPPPPVTSAAAPPARARTFSVPPLRKPSLRRLNSHLDFAHRSSHSTTCCRW